MAGTVPEAAGDASVKLDEGVDGGFGAGAAGLAVGQERLAALLQGLAESLISGTGQVGDGGRDLLSPCTRRWTSSTAWVPS
ncbi:hypothetical protein [Streptomyces vastus]|uniref:hypothetical protein n=1 Tax=Streptomyces vastus TaxID=285451 RepID=UPI0031DAF95C